MFQKVWGVYKKHVIHSCDPFRVSQDPRDTRGYITRALRSISGITRPLDTLHGSRGCAIRLGYHESLMIPELHHMGGVIQHGHYEALVIPENDHRGPLICLGYHKGLVIRPIDHRGPVILLGYHQGLVIPYDGAQGPCDPSVVPQGPRHT